MSIDEKILEYLDATTAKNISSGQIADSLNIPSVDIRSALSRITSKGLLIKTSNLHNKDVYWSSLSLNSARLTTWFLVRMTYYSSRWQIPVSERGTYK